MRKTTDKAHLDLQFNVAQLLKEGMGGSRHYDLKTDPLGQLDDDCTMVSSLHGPIKLVCTGHNVFVTAKLTATLEKSCGRCLAPFNTELVIELEEEFFPSIDIHTGHNMPSVEEIDPANLIDEQHILDLYEVVRQEFVLNAETSRYCKPDCLGLCPVCGRDRNTDPCECHQEKIDPRWAGLLAFNQN